MPRAYILWLKLISVTPLIVHTILTVDETPTLGKLRVLQMAKGNEIRVIDRMAHSWKMLGDLLEIEGHSTKLENIESTCRNRPELCCREVFRCWIKGEGVRPCTWQKLIELVRYCKEIVLADEIENALSPLQSE